MQKQRKKYIEPEIDILWLEETESVDNSNATYAARELNKYFFSDAVSAAGTTTITLQRAVNDKR